MKSTQFTTLFFVGIFMAVVIASAFVVSGRNTDSDSLALDTDFASNTWNPVPGIDSDHSVSLTIDKFYPRGMDYVFHCDAQGFEPDSYSWFFGDGEKLINVTESSVFHRYAAGEYEVICSATDGEQTAEDKIVISVIPQFNSNVFIPTTEDAYTDSIHIHENFGDSEELKVGYEFMGNSTYISYLKFDLGALNNVPVKSAELWVYKADASDTDVTHDLTRVMEDWKESEITWLNSPQLSENITSSVETERQIGWVKFDVTDDVVNYRQGIYENHGWAIEHSSGGSGIDFETSYLSSEAENKHLRPRLVITT